MVTGPLRVIFWILGSIGALWLIVGLTSLPYMGRMMGDDGSMDGGMMGGEGMLGMMSMMGTMALQLIGMLGLVGIFVYLVIDTVRGRRSASRK